MLSWIHVKYLMPGCDTGQGGCWTQDLRLSGFLFETNEPSFPIKLNGSLEFHVGANYRRAAVICVLQ